MINDFALELKTARRKAGLSQADCAHLLGVHPSKISLLESGRVLPSIRHICRLSVMYGRSFESLFGDIFNDARRCVRKQLHLMPEAPRRWLGNFNRENTLRALANRLNSEPDEDYVS
jgi:transcriptional regulator with XRE-family HTH domain